MIRTYRAASDSSRRIAIKAEVSATITPTTHPLAGRDGDESAWSGLDQFVARAGIEVVAQDQTQVDLAQAAFLRFGQGRDPAALNMGDCAAYALAKARDLPLLFKGDDFIRTDVVAA